MPVLFIGEYLNKVDAKGRVSIPSRWRSMLASDSFQGVVLAPSADPGAVDGCTWERLQSVAAGLDDRRLYTDEQRKKARVVMRKTQELPFDRDGRIILPPALVTHAGISGQAMLAGNGPTFQIWNPDAYADQERAEAADGLTGIGGLEDLPLPGVGDGGA